MLRSLFSGITGLRAHQTLMDVVSNNISNVNTTGFKSSSALFEDTLSQTLRGAGSPTSIGGGTNPAQVGLGVQLAGISTNFSQGSAQNTGTASDLMIQGDGFFIVENGGETEYTRSGAFKFDATGTLVTADGAFVQGWLATSTTDAVTGVTTVAVNTDTSVGKITVPAGQLMSPKATSNVAISGNISSIPVAATAQTITLGQTVFDKSGGAHNLSIVLTQDISDTTGVTWSADIFDTTLDPTLASSVSGGPQPLTFDPATGLCTAPVAGTPIVLTLASADATAINLDLSGITRYGGSQSIAVTTADGYAAGSLTSYQIGEDGSVIGKFNNEQKQLLGKIALANFNNPSGLEKAGATCFRSTTNSGLAQVGTPGSGGRGSLLGGSLEMSNVDLAQEFTNLIIAQRGFQANSRVISTSDQMLQDLVDIKR